MGDGADLVEMLMDAQDGQELQRKPAKKKVVMELVGLNGNAFMLLGAFSKNARRQGWTQEEIEVVTKKATSGNYNHCLSVLIENTQSPDDPGDED